MPFTCSICEEASTRICIACTKDSCENHLCEKCLRCSDCCGCEVSLNHQETALTGSLNGETPFLTDEPMLEAAAAAVAPDEPSLPLDHEGVVPDGYQSPQ